MVEKLTREEAITETLENNFGIKMAKNDLRIADNNQGDIKLGISAIDHWDSPERITVYRIRK